MTNHLVISNFATGFQTNREPFLINNDSFPTIINEYIFRGRLQKKLGTSLLGRLQVNLTDQSLGNTDGSGVFTGNIISILSLFASSSIVLGSVTIHVGAQDFTDTNPPTGVLSNGSGGTGTINYSTGDVSITTNPVLMNMAVTIDFGYYPNLPVMGLEDFETNIVNFPTLVAFDTKLSYQFNFTTRTFYDVNFYKNSGVPFTWNGTDYDQFWSTNWQGAMFVTNGNPGFNFASVSNLVQVGGPPSNTITITTTATNLVIGDFLFFNEFTGGNNTLNGLSGEVTGGTAGVYDVNLSASITIAGGAVSDGIIQLLTNSSNNGDGIKWYDGDPTTSSNTLGWVNFAPPLDNTATTGVTKYLAGAKALFTFKDRLLAFGVYTITSTGSFVFNPNQVVWCQNGTVYYSNPVPANQSADPSSWFQNIGGRGGRLNAPIDQQFITVGQNEDVLICDFEKQPLKLMSTGDDSLPFIFHTISSELGAESTFSSIPLDLGLVSFGTYGLALKTQTSSQRMDLQIPDQAFEFCFANNGDQRVTATRDWRNELLYFSYNALQNNFNSNYKFPNQTLVYNYRENNWALFNENYTHYGIFRNNNNLTWATVGEFFHTWAEWTTAWSFGEESERFPFVAAGNQQGFVMLRVNDNTTEEDSQYISAISNATITSPNHNLLQGDFIQISGIIGDPSMEALNNNVNSDPKVIGTYKVAIVDENNFVIIGPPNLPPVSTTGTYLGGGVYTRLTNINVLTKQFPVYWGNGRQVRFGNQKFLIGNAGENSSITVDIYVNQDDDNIQNNTANESLIYSNVLLTGPEPSLIFRSAQNQIWHRLSNSFFGDTIQVGFRMSDDQMYDPILPTREITIHAMAFEIYPGPPLAI